MQNWGHLWKPSFPRMTSLKSENVWSSRSTPLIISSNNSRLLNILLPFSFYPSLGTFYWLHTTCINSNFNNRIVIPSYNFNVAKFPKHFWQHIYPKFHHYLDLSFLDKFYKELLLHWLIPITCIQSKLALHVWIAYMIDGRIKVPSTHQY